MLRGSINHVSVTVRDLDVAMQFFGPVLEFLGYAVDGVPLRNASTGSRLTVNVNQANGTAFNVWEAKPELADHPFEIYEVGLHHVAWNVASRSAVDGLCDLVVSLGAEILDGPGDFPFDDDGKGYYAVYFRGPDGLKFECVHMPGLEEAFREKGVLS